MGAGNNIKIIKLSLVSNEPAKALEEIIEYACSKRESLLVAAAGNLKTSKKVIQLPTLISSQLLKPIKKIKKQFSQATTIGLI